MERKNNPAVAIFPELTTIAGTPRLCEFKKKASSDHP